MSADKLPGWQKEWIVKHRTCNAQVTDLGPVILASKVEELLSRYRLCEREATVTIKVWNQGGSGEFTSIGFCKLEEAHKLPHDTPLYAEAKEPNP